MIFKLFLGVKLNVHDCAKWAQSPVIHCRLLNRIECNLYHDSKLLIVMLLIYEPD